jgi:hypothetical protein
MPATNSRSLLGKIKKFLIEIKSFLSEALKSFFRSDYCENDILNLLPKDKSEIPTILTLTLK